MKAEWVQPWIDALRSGEFPQGRDFLCKNGKYCCLGVACVLASIPYNKKVEFLGTTKHYVIEFEALPKMAGEELGIGNEIGKFDRNQVRWPDSIPADSRRNKNSLADLNDKGLTFNQIADFIELNWEVL